RVEPWRAALGYMKALEVTRVQLDALCRRWRKHGPVWGAGERLLSDGTRITWPKRDKQRGRPLSGGSCNRRISVLPGAYTLGKEKLQLSTSLTFPYFAGGQRGEYITEDQCVALCQNFQAKEGAAVKAAVFRLAYLTGIRKGRLRNARKRHVLIVGDTW